MSHVVPLQCRQLAYCSWLHRFPSLSLCPQYPRLVFPPTLPIILDVITHYNVTHKGKRPLCLETDLSRTSSSLCIWVKKVSLRANRLSDICIFIISQKTNYSPEITFIQVFCQTAKKKKNWQLLHRLMSFKGRKVKWATPHAYKLNPRNYQITIRPRKPSVFLQLYHQNTCDWIYMPLIYLKR